MFDRADRHTDNLVSKRELILALRKDLELCAELGLPSHIRQEGASRDAFERFFLSIDQDHDMQISWKEFAAFHEQHHMKAVSEAIAWENHAITAGDAAVPTVGIRDMGGGRLRYAV
jgi:hypothetical protein